MSRRGRFWAETTTRLSAEEISRRTQAALRLCQLTDVARAAARSARRASDGGGRQSGGDSAACAIAGCEPSRDF